MSLSMPHRGSSEKSRSRLRLCPCRSRSRPAFGAELRPPVRWRAVGSLRLLIGGRTASGAAWQNAYGEDPYSVARRRRYLHTATSPTESASHNRNLHFCAPRPYAAFIEPPDPRAGAAPHVEDLALVIDSAPEGYVRLPAMRTPSRPDASDRSAMATLAQPSRDRGTELQRRGSSG